MGSDEYNEPAPVGMYFPGKGLIYTDFEKDVLGDRVCDYDISHNRLEVFSLW
jgi:hypothetical protein